MTIEYIDGFHELMKPKQAQNGKWIANGSVESMYHLLNSFRLELCDLAQISLEDIKDNLYFDSEWECLQEVRGYYLSHGRTYPHMKEWTNGEAEDKNALGSQIMVFK